MRMAWKTRATVFLRIISSATGEIFFLYGTAAAMTVASCVVRSKGRAAMMAFAMRPACASSEPARMRSLSARSSYVFTTSCAVSDDASAFMRMSSGPSNRSEKPRAAASSWCDETPRSKSTPSANSPPHAASMPPSKLDRTARKRSEAILAVAVAIASASWSTPTTRPRFFRAARSAAEWPPPPSVPSTYRPSFSVTSHSHTSLSMTGMW
mmetsp:Transcript_4914/g.15563  ORF Transcript_4914/g.15563 Transcript_4914/m.15563 type:complete len:210 (-) Transcript_4914:373-1002(-)